MVGALSLNRLLLLLQSALRWLVFLRFGKKHNEMVFDPSSVPQWVMNWDDVLRIWTFTYLMGIG